METFDKFWNYTLFTISGGGQINVSQVIVTVLFILIALLLGRFLMRLLAQYMTRVFTSIYEYLRGLFKGPDTFYLRGRIHFIKILNL